MSKFIATSSGDRLQLGSEFNKARFLKDLRENIGARYRIEREVPESRNQRGFYHGAIIPLWIYLDGNDFRDSHIQAHYHNEAKKEFNGEWIVRAGKTEKVGRSTRGELNGGFLEKVIEFIEEQYGVDRNEVLNPEDYKIYRDTIQGNSNAPENYIEYLVSLGRLGLAEYVNAVMR